MLLAGSTRLLFILGSARGTPESAHADRTRICGGEKTQGFFLSQGILGGQQLRERAQSETDLLGRCRTLEFCFLSLPAAARLLSAAAP